MMEMSYIKSKGMSLTNYEEYANVAQQKPLIQPRFGEFQLIGDGLLVCFADKILQQPYRIINGIRTMGYCVSGQRIDQLRQRIKLKTYPLSTKVMVLIGTNDVLYGGNIGTMTKHFNALLNLLEKSVEKVLIMTLPPIPKLCVTYYHWTLIRRYNAFLKSLENGRSIIVADICPIFTKLQWALEYQIDVKQEPPCEKINSTKRRKASLNCTRKYLSEKRNSFSLAEGSYQNISDRSESDYRNTTDTSTSFDSEILSSELSQERGNMQNATMKQGTTEARDMRLKSRNKIVRSSEKINYSTTRYVLRTFQSVFGKDVLMRRKEMREEKSKRKSLEQSEESLRKSPTDLNETMQATDNWQVESGEDSMNEHVYKSQEEIEYDVIDMSGSQWKKKEGNELFSRFLESCNVNEVMEAGENRRRKKKRNELFLKSCSDNDERSKRSFSYRRLKRDSFLKEEMESSSSSDNASPRKQIHPYVDGYFRYFVEKYTSGAGESDCFVNSDKNMHYTPGKTSTQTQRNSYNSPKFVHSNVVPPPTPPIMPESSICQPRNNCIQCFLSPREFKNIDGG